VVADWEAVVVVGPTAYPYPAYEDYRQEGEWVVAVAATGRNSSAAVVGLPGRAGIL
jgi:hypothetical protein